MRAVVQRVSGAQVSVEGEIVAGISTGLLVLLGVAQTDTPGDAKYLAEKIAGLRVFPDGEGKMNLCVREAGGEVLAVSQFTLLGDCRRGKRPSFSAAAAPTDAMYLFDQCIAELRQRIGSVKTGVFGAMMEVALVNSGPVTILLDSAKQF
ncbi:MAG: D-aminoacyl-tRNA deacylase [Firmicutes bacterium]|nr:D-aminoacyl-tRNA deacylase [candidate division NPL-UPA2 bacterium]MBT9155511.1 D-aminoacyl-tRNA deacylase [candidate division NPL-UPA2 bacterium]